MPYIGHNPTQAGSFVLLDDIASGFDGSDVTFTLQIGGVDITPTADNLIIALDGVMQHSPEAYTVSGSTLTFTAAPASGVDFYGMLMGQSASIGQGAIGADELSVTGDGSANQMLVSDGDGTMTWKGSGLSATSATGDLIYRNSSGELARLAVGSAGQVLTVASGLPAWETDVESYLPLSGGTMSGALNMGSQAITNAGTITGTFSGNLTGNVTGNVSGTAASVTGAAQTNITSVGTLAGLTVSKSSGWAAEFYQTAADQHGVGIHVGNNTSNNSAFEVQNSAESATYFKISQKAQISTTQTNANLYGLEVYHSGANTTQPAHLIWGNNSGSTQAIVRIHENGTRSNLATPVFEVLGTSSNTELFKVRADGNAYFSGQGTFYDNLNVIKSSSATMTIKGNAANANASLTFMEQSTTMWEIRGDGGASDKLSFIDTGGAEVLALAQDSSATFTGSLYVTNTGPQVRLTDTDFDRYGNIYYGTRAFLFDNVMDNEALDSVDPWFEFRFVTAESGGTYTSMMKIERNAYTFNEAYNVNFTNTGSNSNVNINAGGGSARLYLDATNSSGEYGEVWFQAAGNTVGGIQTSNAGVMTFYVGGSSTQTCTFNSNGTTTWKHTMNIRKASGDGDLYLYNADASQGLRIDQNSIRTTTNNGFQIFPNDNSSKGINIHNDGALLVLGGSSHTHSANVNPVSDNAYDLGHSGTKWRTVNAHNLNGIATDYYSQVSQTGTNGAYAYYDFPFEEAGLYKVVISHNSNYSGSGYYREFGVYYVTCKISWTTRYVTQVFVDQVMARTDSEQTCTPYIYGVSSGSGELFSGANRWTTHAGDGSTDCIMGITSGIKLGIAVSGYSNNTGQQTNVYVKRVAVGAS